MRKIFFALMCVSAIACDSSTNGTPDEDTSNVDGQDSGTGTAVLTWTPPTAATDGGPAGVVGYRVYYGTASASYGAPMDVGNVTTYTMTELAPATYYFAVTAYDSAGGESDFSGEASKVIAP